MSSARRKLFVLLLCCTAQFMVILDVSIVNVALPSIRRDLGFSAADLQWVVNAYTLAFAGFLMLGGRAADLLGQRPVFAAGLGLFGVASLLGGLATSDAVLVVARTIQGLGGAIVAPATLSVITTTFSEGAERNRALSAWGAMGGAGGATGALLGGVLTEALSWRWIFIINVPIAIGAVAAALAFVPPIVRDRGERRSFDLAGAVTITAGLVAIVFAIVRTSTNGWGSPKTLGVLAVGLALIGVFLLIEGRLSARPLVPLRIFRSRSVTGANVVVFLLGCSIFAMWYFLSLYLQQVLGYSPIQAGVSFLPMTAAIVVGSTFAGRLTNRVGAAWMLTVGMAMSAAGMVLFARLPLHGSYGLDVLGPSVLVALGLGLSFVPVTIAAVTGVERSEAGLASGLVNTSRQIGGALGLAVLATVATSRTGSLHHLPAPDALLSGYHRAFIVGAGFALAGSVAAALLVPRVRRAPAAAAAAGEASA
jgi:EmrB/QacA subfamily drug resistance transporter